MIKAEELRSGNLVMGEPFNCARIGYRDGVVALTAYGIGMIESDKKYAGYYEGIPLSLESLTRCGFAHNDEHELCIKIKNKEDYGLYYDYHFKRFEIRDEYWDWRLPMEHIKFIHQLQNLYFALTGTELTINF